MARLNETAQLLGLALLNLADDEGYFLAEPSLVRSFARPFDEDSRKTIGALRDLSSAGWISIKNSQTHGPIGMVVNFSKHQYIQRATQSKLKTYYDSDTTHGGLTEVYQQERKGREQGREGIEEHVSRKRSTSHNTRIPEDFVPKEDHYQIAKELGTNCESAFITFRDHFLGNGKTMRDWDAAFRNWLRREITFSRNGRARSNGRPSGYELQEQLAIAAKEAIAIAESRDAKQN